MPSRFSTQYVSGISDSPMWKRGKRSRSNRPTRTPCCASNVDTVEPAGPPPMTTTSKSVIVRADVFAGSRVADARVCRQEETVEEHVHAQQPGTRQRDAVVRQLRQVALGTQRRQRLGETCERIDAVLLLEVRRPYGAALELQDELANQPLIGIGSVGAPERQPPGLQRFGIALPRVQVLHVDAVDVAERRDADADEIRAFPQPVAIDERRPRRVLDGGVGAADVIAGALERLERLRNPAPLRAPVGDGAELG